MHGYGSGLYGVGLYGIDTTGTYTATIGGSAVFVIAGSLNVVRSVGRKSQAGFRVKTNIYTFFAQGQVVKIYDQSGALAFSGHITSPKAQKPGYQPSLTWTISCIG